MGREQVAAQQRGRGEAEGPAEPGLRVGGDHARQADARIEREQRPQVERHRRGVGDFVEDRLLHQARQDARAQEEDLQHRVQRERPRGVT